MLDFKLMIYNVILPTTYFVFKSFIYYSKANNIIQYIIVVYLNYFLQGKNIYYIKTTNN